MPRKKKMTLFILGIVLIAAAVIGGVWFWGRMSRPNSQLPEKQISIDGHTFTAEVASTMMQQATGLSFRKSIASDHGMLFVFNSPSIQNFWMKDMNFSIDMIWISGNKIVGFAQDAAPQPGDPLWKLKIYSSPDGTDKVLEVTSGTVTKDNIKVGDTVLGL
jgi:uncharacterized protein